jgi:polysaccharide export outer membrane protein
MRIDLAQAASAPPHSRKLEDHDVVMVLAEDKRVIHVTGLVRKPDQFELDRNKDIRVLDAIAMAGGTTSVVADKVYVIRKFPNMTQPAVIDVSIARAKQNGNENLLLAAGDLVSVETTAATMMVDTVTKFIRLAIGVNGNWAAF